MHALLIPRQHQVGERPSHRLDDPKVVCQPLVLLDLDDDPTAERVQHEKQVTVTVAIQDEHSWA